MLNTKRQILASSGVRGRKSGWPATSHLLPKQIASHTGRPQPQYSSHHIVLLPAVNTGVIVWQTVDLPARCSCCSARCPGGNTARGSASVNTNCTVVGIAHSRLNSRSLGWLSCGVCGFYQSLEGNSRSTLNTPGVVIIVLVDGVRLMNCLPACLTD